MIKLLVSLLAVLALVAGGNYYYENEKTKELAESVNQLTLAKQNLEASLKVTTQENSQLSQKLSLSEEATKKAIAELNKAKKPIVVPIIKDKSTVTEDIKKYYNDDTVKFVATHFEIAEITTYKLMTDAISWKINYPVMQDEMDKSSKVIASIQAEGKVKDTLIVGLQNANKLQAADLNNNQQLIDNIRKSLIVEEEKSKMRTVLYCAGGLVAGYFVGKSIK